MQKVKIFLVLFLAFCASFYTVDQYLIPKEENRTSSPPLTQQQEKTELDATDQKLIASSEQFFRQTLLRSRFNGAILVARAGKIIFEQYHGLKEITKGLPIDSTTAFHLASVSKTFTAMAVLKLWEEGVLDIDQPVANYLLNFPFKQITVRNLLNHRSGLPNYLHFVENLGWDSKQVLSNQDLLDLMLRKSNQMRVGRPNAYFDYCNTNYALLALVVEKVSNLSFGEYLYQNFFRRLGMEHSFVFKMEDADRVLPSFKFNNQKEPFTFLDAVYGDKNIYSTPRDLMKWDQALASGTLFSSKTLEEAFKGYSYEKKGVRNYGLGWRLNEIPSGKKFIYHNGWWHGNNTVFIRLPDDATSIIVLGNKYNRSIYQSKKIAGVLDGYGIDYTGDE